MSRKLTVSQFSWGVLGYTVLVILWGAFVRATGSGAGCGEHWPLCNGEVVPRAESVKTAIEFTHRITSGLSLIAVLAMARWIRRVHPVGHLARKAAGWSVFFIFTEALIGAGLVKLGLVAGNQSPARAVALGLHLMNTLLLLGAMAATAIFAASKNPRWEKLDTQLKLLAGGALGLSLVLGASGAITALGDTLFPGHPTDLSGAAHFLIRLRILHPLLAVATGALMVILFQAFRLRHKGGAKAALISKWGTAVTALVGTQLVVGLTNVALLAPTWIQLVHLTLADALWVSLVGLVLAGASSGQRS